MKPFKYVTHSKFLRWSKEHRSSRVFLFPTLSASFPEFSRENSAFVSTRVDWKADLPGLTKEEVKVEIEDDTVLQISGERNMEKEDKKDK
ncbi:unnamed protein product [Sphenostylis stenocarpa]|uniref:SHSP domain-containing protein n=1 Tax=Sphenostylis stenocarpa TaxID=92480 RepID=A0AA86S3N1_9FABA|nr:unnamed protein product [Sphenostylis stenocarpa]